MVFIIAGEPYDSATMQPKDLVCVEVVISTDVHEQPTPEPIEFAINHAHLSGCGCFELTQLILGVRTAVRFRMVMSTQRDHAACVMVIHLIPRGIEVVPLQERALAPGDWTAVSDLSSEVSPDF